MVRETLARAERHWRDRTIRRWVVVAPDQLTDDVGPLAAPDIAADIAADRPPSTGIILVESDAWLRQRPYHRQKLATILLNQRAFALEQSARGLPVRYVESLLPYGEALAGAVGELTGSGAAVPELLMMEPAGRSLRQEVERLVSSGRLRFIPNELWLTAASQHGALHGRSPQALGPHEFQRFYDAARSAFPSTEEGPCDRVPDPVAAPRPPRFRRSPLRDQVEREILTRFSRHPGTLDIGLIPASKSDAQRLWRWALQSCVPSFDRFEGSMRTRSRGLFHTRMSPIINIGRLAPRRLVSDVLEAAIPAAAKEAFLRQLLGWREFIHHLFLAGEAAGTPASAASSGRFRAWPSNGSALDDELVGSVDLPPAWAGRQSGMACLDRVVASVWAEGWSSPTARRMILANIANLLGVAPEALTTWFGTAFADAYDWVVEPNVELFSTFAHGVPSPLPIASGHDIARASDFCDECVFDPTGDCPVNALYRHFLREHPGLRSPRTGAAKSDSSLCPASLAAIAHDEALAERDRRAFVHISSVLVRGERLSPQGLRMATQGEAQTSLVTDSLTP